MTGTLFDSPQTAKPALPEPQRERWQPLRIGVVELFHYDSEEFWFRDGHLLLRGNNGTGKSKVLSLTLPFLFDAQLRSSRVEPDGDNSKRMAWNLLMDGYQRRIGYTWIEFGMRQADGSARYLTLGAGLSAVNGKTHVDSWFFLIEGQSPGQDPRIGQDLWLTSEQRIVLTRERLRELLEGQGQGIVFENAHSYRRAVDERLFHLGPKRYEALMDTLIQLRQPQLSKKPDETSLSHALTEALPPMPQELLVDVAQALNQLEEDREQLDKTRQLEQAVRHFEHRYRIYAGTLTRRQARELRQAQTAFDNASEDRNRTQGALREAELAKDAATQAHDTAKSALASARERLETLQSDPANQDANRLGQAEKDAKDREEEAAKSVSQHSLALQNLKREEERREQSERRTETARIEITTARSQCESEAQTAGTSFALSNNPAIELPVEEIAVLPAADVGTAIAKLRIAANDRRNDIRHMERRHAALATKQSTLQTLQTTQHERRAELEDATERRAEADMAAETEGNRLVDAWTTYCAGLEQLQLDVEQPLSQLATWVIRPDGPNPAQSALSVAYSDASVRHANRQAVLEARQASVEQEQTDLRAERERLIAGHDAVPPAPFTRSTDARQGRQGAPLWQLVDFRPHVEPAGRAGLEAALEVSGLLDAWISPDGEVTQAEGAPIWDTQWRRRPPPIGESLLTHLHPVTPDRCPIEPALVETLLASVACGREDDPSLESWVATDGRFRLGTLTGAWLKSEAIYIGHTARTQARQRRLQAIDQRLHELGADADILSQDFENLANHRVRAKDELDGLPSDDAVREAILATAGAAREVLQARKRFDNADSQCQAAEIDLQREREELANDATDLQLPVAQADLTPIAHALDRFTETHHALSQAIREWQSAWPDYLQQREREAEARNTLTQREEEVRNANSRAEQARARHSVLQEAVGAKVETLRHQLGEASQTVQRIDAEAELKQKALTDAATAYGVAQTHFVGAENVLAERTAARALAIERLQRFTESSLLASALPDIPIPLGTATWTIDPALQLARRAEQALANIADDDNSWARVQRQVSEDLTELQRSLSALGHQATSEPNDWGFTVHVTYQNRSERPDTLAAHLADDVAQRSELLSAKEREVLENHLQAEIAAEIQRLMRAADKQVETINEELYKRPTTTGVRYRLQWLALSSEEGGPIGLEIARERLLNTSSDLWSAEDRRVVGTMLQQQIAMERDGFAPAPPDTASHLS
ncbi:TIGR02680 family protein [Ralstonia solanacearum]|uniref:TIGR02680 family protein n=1 Tax=Ralstonia solanacearum TaxID=305 RepID=UPI0001D96246|nr:TIGR02680 family protein [Ralstonia solanacearum]CBJ34596.1 conserved hypothetical protein; putative ATPase [Ralstonia solanacearum PSI07]